jgi:site-specific DNA recombinase
VHPGHAFSRLAPWSASSPQDAPCFGAREKGTCSNHLTIRRDEVEARVLKALEQQLLNQELFEEFCDEFTSEMNRLRMQHRASFSAAEREIERIEIRRKKLIEMAMNGIAPSEIV